MVNENDALLPLHPPTPQIKAVQLKKLSMDLRDAASLSSRTLSKSLWTAIQSLRFHCRTEPEAPFL